MTLASIENIAPSLNLSCDHISEEDGSDENLEEVWH